MIAIARTAFQVIRAPLGHQWRNRRVGQRLE
jgi:hypothetical protein